MRKRGRESKSAGDYEGRGRRGREREGTCGEREKGERETFDLEC